MLPYPAIDPVAVALGPIRIHWYGLAYLAGIGIGWWMAARRSQRPWSPLQRAQVDDLVFYLALGVVLGGRLGYTLFYGGERLLQDPLWLLRVWEGGMSFHGGLLGVLLAMWLFARRRQLRFGAVMDFVAPLIPVGLGLGRLGNFIGQELWGRATDVPWAMVFPADPLGLARHPSQLYQAFLEGVVLLVVMLWYSRRPRPTWAVAGMFSLVYGCLRFGVEFFRQPDAHIHYLALGWMTRGQMLSLPMVVLGLYLLWYAHRQAALAKAGKAAKADKAGKAKP